MLVLSRHRDEGIVIGTDPPIVVTVVDIRGDKVRLGVTAPREIPVHRDEVYKKILGERLAAGPGGAGAEGERSWREWHERNRTT